jgi:phage shock protein PspC (stress-responsive transcriptional regulator)
MSDASPDFKISRAGKVIHENLSLAQVVQGVASKSIQATDHYWSTGMTDWALVSSRQWAVAPTSAPAPAPAATPAPVPTPKPVPATPAAVPAVKPTPVTNSAPAATKPASASSASQPRPDPSTAKTPSPQNPSVPALLEPVEKGFSPYVTFYRSDDDRWAFGVFGGLAHRNCWPKPLLLLVRVLMLVSVFPALSYLGWGFTVMLLTPSLPTSKVRSYYDLTNGKPSRDSTDLTRLIKILVVGFIVLFVVGWLISRRF